MTAIIKDDLITERTSLDDELIFDHEPDLLDTSDAPTLTVTASNGTPIVLTRASYHAAWSSPTRWEDAPNSTKRWVTQRSLRVTL